MSMGTQCTVCGTAADHKDRDGQMLCSKCALDKHKDAISAMKTRKENMNVRNR
jgi:hypothetical protein